MEQRIIELKDVVELDRVVCAIDIETLSLSLNALVYEIGVVCTSFLPIPGTKWGVKDLDALVDLSERNTDNDLVFSYTRVPLSIVEQVLSGRHVDNGTVQFHEKVFAKRGLSHKNEFRKHELNALTLDDARGLLDLYIGNIQPKEVWFNHTSFDSPRITNVLYNGEANSVPWNYRSEYDVFTYKQSYGEALKDGDRDYTKFSTDNDHHDSIGDCLYNLAVLSACRFGARASRRMAL